MRPKRLDLFLLKTFLPVFCMTFFICLFIVLMQFLWQRIDELVGKGLGVDLIGELFFYAMLTCVPLALPLAVLLASLMTFGNLGEHFELTAMKAAGVSLTRAMRPLVVVMVFVAIGAFFFQNNVLPVAQTKMWTLLFSVRQKSPEVEIPEGVFYDQIPGYNLFVHHKDKETGKLYGMMIYDVSRGPDNAMVMLADSGRLAFTADKTHIFLKLWSGESFENLQDMSSAGGDRSKLKNVPYRRESFSHKEIVMPFDANFTRIDEQAIRSQYVGKNIVELNQSIKEIHERLDSIGRANGESMRQYYVGRLMPVNKHNDRIKVEDQATARATTSEPINVDSLLHRGGATYAVTDVQNALTQLRLRRQEVEFRSMSQSEDMRELYMHGIELHRKFTLSFACIIFFFIGAPLGAIIRKGGLGVPVVISVILFIIYYIIDNTGYKMARDGRMAVWEGMWLSSAVLLPLGIFLTYKAVNDSVVFNADAWTHLWNRLLGRRTKRTLEYREVVMDDCLPAVATDKLHTVERTAETFLKAHPSPQGYQEYWMKGYSPAEVHAFARNLEDAVHYLVNSRKPRVVAMLNRFPVLRNLWLYRPAPTPVSGRIGMILFPIGLPLWLAGRFHQRILLKETKQIISISQTLIKDISTPDEQP